VCDANDPSICGEVSKVSVELGSCVSVRVLRGISTRIDPEVNNRQADSLIEKVSPPQW